MQTQQSNKTIRFNAITQAYQLACQDLDLTAAELIQSFAAEDDGADLTLADRKKFSLQGKFVSDYRKLNFIAKKMIEVFKAKTDDKFWVEYWRLLDEAKNQYEEFDYKPGFEREHIDFAIRNAFFGYISLIHLIPKVYKKQFSQEISLEDYKKASRNIEPLICHLAKFHFDVFRAFIYATSKLTAGISSNLHEFYPQYFYLDEDLALHLNDEAREKIKEESIKLSAKGKLRTSEPSIGCPALFTKNSQQEDLIKICLHWVLEILEQSFFKGFGSRI